MKTLPAFIRNLVAFLQSIDWMNVFLTSVTLFICAVCGGCAASLVLLATTQLLPVTLVGLVAAAGTYWFMTVLSAPDTDESGL